MVRALKGVLLTCDPAVKQIILSINENLGPNAGFIIADLDDQHVLVKGDMVTSIREQLAEEVCVARRLAYLARSLHNRV
jgi:TFIIH basal transcription factor complex TTD-A subunit